MRQHQDARRGQSTAEYAVLFALVIGAAIAMQQYVKGRLQGATQHFADQYSAGAGNTGTFDPARTSTSESGTDLTFQGSQSGGVHSASGSTTTVDKSQN